MKKGIEHNGVKLSRMSLWVLDELTVQQHRTAYCKSAHTISILYNNEEQHIVQ